MHVNLTESSRKNTKFHKIQGERIPISCYLIWTLHFPDTVMGFIVPLIDPSWKAGFLNAILICIIQRESLSFPPNVPLNISSKFLYLLSFPQQIRRSFYIKELKISLPVRSWLYYGRQRKQKKLTNFPENRPSWMGRWIYIVDWVMRHFEDSELVWGIPQVFFQYDLNQFRDSEGVISSRHVCVYMCVCY